MKLLKDIMNNWGFIDSEQIKELACYFPDMELIIKWGMSPREKVRASQVAFHIKQKEDLHGDYCREVFIESAQFRKLKEVFGLNTNNT
tara:strand:+ start:240 stop:503 length:264 start_codon:yes stop_codon:yes gene_type:complete